MNTAHYGSHKRCSISAHAIFDLVVGLHFSQSTTEIPNQPTRSATREGRLLKAGVARKGWFAALSPPSPAPGDPSCAMPTVDVVFTVFSAIGFILVLIPFPWHLEAWNTGTCFYMIWTALGCLNWFINSILFRNTAVNKAPVWCDISSRITIAINVGIPAASLCIMRRLYHISSVRSATITRREKRRVILADCAIALGIPFIEQFAYYIVEGHRFDILEDIGCYPTVYNTPVGFFFVFVWPIVIGLVSGVYGCLTIRAFAKRRSRFKELLSQCGTINADRYWRLMALATVDLACTVPFSIWAVYQNAVLSPVYPYISFKSVHHNFSKVRQIARVFWAASPEWEAGVETTRWACVACAFVFFAFFGFADEARKHYRIAFVTVAKRVGYSSVTLESTYRGKFGSVLPSFVRPQTSFPDEKLVQPRDSMAERDSVRMSIGSVYVDAKKEKDDELARPGSPSSISSSSSGGSSRRSSMRSSFDSDIERRASTSSPIELPAFPEPVLDASSPPRPPPHDLV